MGSGGAAPERATPVRTCVGCRTARPVADGLVRVAVGPDGTPQFGRTLPGRGAWLCANPDCLELALRKRTLARALRCDVDAEAAVNLRTRFPADRPGARD